MYLFLIRHSETEKNTKKEFSDDRKSDTLTVEGIEQANKIANKINEFASTINVAIKCIYTSNSVRAVQTATQIGSYLNIPVKEITGLYSLRIDAIGGLSERDVEKKYPLLFKQLHLYRGGVLNSYNISFPEDAEQPIDFELRVKKNLKTILDIPNEKIKIIILHRSVLTATIIAFARKYYNYPKNFYGYIPLENGRITVLKFENNNWNFIRINELPENLNIQL